MLGHLGACVSHMALLTAVREMVGFLAVEIMEKNLNEQCMAWHIG